MPSNTLIRNITTHYTTADTNKDGLISTDEIEQLLTSLEIEGAAEVTDDLDLEHFIEYMIAYVTNEEGKILAYEPPEPEVTEPEVTEPETQGGTET